MSVRVIGINGFKRAGKGETAAAIADLGSTLVPGFNVRETGFADKLKILGAKALGFVDRPDEECIALMNECKEDWLFSISKHLTKEERTKAHQVGGIELVMTLPNNPIEWHTLTGREYLQNLGNEARGVFGEDFWVDQVLPKPGLDGGLMRRPSGVAHPETRYALTKRYPGVDLLAISDLRYPNEAQRVLDCGGEVWEVIRPGTASDGHASEQVLDRKYVTRQIDNSGDLLALRYEVEKALGL